MPLCQGTLATGNLLCIEKVGAMELPFDKLLKVCANDLIKEEVWSELDQFQHNGERVQVSLGSKGLGLGLEIFPMRGLVHHLLG